MAEVVRLVGIEARDYKDKATGEQRRFCALHCAHVPGSQRGVEGSKVEVIRKPRDVQERSLKIGNLYELSYSHFDRGNDRIAYVSDLTPVEG